MSMGIAPVKRRKGKLDEHRSFLTEWFAVEQLTLAQAAGRLREKFGVSVSLARLSSWWAAVQLEDGQNAMLERITNGATVARQVEEGFGKNAAPEVETLVKLLRVLIMQLSVQGATDPRMLNLVSTLMKPVMDFVRVQQTEKKLAQEEEKIAQAERRLEALTEKQAAAKAKLTEVASKGGLSPETLAEIEQAAQLL